LEDDFEDYGQRDGQLLPSNVLAVREFSLLVWYSNSWDFQCLPRKFLRFLKPCWTLPLRSV